MENRDGLLVVLFSDRGERKSGARCRYAHGLAEEAIPSGKRVTLGEDKNYDTRNSYQNSGD